jgi:DNA invertase Pin-like site-specific DNA recombinase
LTFTGEDFPMATLLLSVMGAFAEFERSVIRERQREGIALARRRGAYRGRKPALGQPQADQLVRRAYAGESVTRLAREFGISRQTAYEYIRARRDDATSGVPTGPQFRLLTCTARLGGNRTPRRAREGHILVRHVFPKRW